MNCELYPRVLGSSWWELAEPVRRAHAVGGEKSGSFRISHGAGWLARRLAAWSGLPRKSGLAATRLRIVPEGAGQRWERHFGGEVFATRQWVDGGCLFERFGAWELCFSLRVEEEALRYEQRAAGLCLGRLRVPVPLACAPLVSAREAPEGPERVRVSVTVRLPLVGLLIAYHGHLDVGGPTS